MALKVSTLTTTMLSQPTYAFIIRQLDGPGSVATSGYNVYVIWASNKTGNWEVIFRASPDNGNTFGDKINISNSSNGFSASEELAASGDNVYASWHDNSTGSIETFMRRSNDDGVTFGPLLRLAANGTIGS